MNKENLRLLRNILFRTFVVGIVLVLILGALTIYSWESCASLSGEWFNIDPAVLVPVVFEFFATVRFFLLFVVLAPALALHWTLKKEM